MGVVTLPDTPYAKEMAKWEKPYRYEPYPAMLYKATRTPKGQVIFEYQTAGDELAQRNLMSRGFVPGGQGEAVRALEAQEREIAAQAANRAYHEQRMSEPARAEAARVDAQTDAHVPVIPETPVKRRGRPKKDAAPAA